MVRYLVFSLGLLLVSSIWAVWPTTGAAIISGKTAPELAGENWLNSQPLSIDGLRGRVVLVEFWTYG